MLTSHAGALMPHIPEPPDLTVILLMHFVTDVPLEDPFIDSSLYVRPLLGNGGAQLSSDVTLDGATVGKFNSTIDYVTAPSSADFDFGAGDFTIETFIYTNVGSTGVGMVFGNVNFAGAPSQGFYLNISGATPNFYFYGNDSFRTFAGTIAMTKGEWHHLAIVRSDGTVRIYIDGGAAGGGLDEGSSIIPSVAPIKVGGDPEAVFTNWTGYLDELRITRGVARYSGIAVGPGTCFTVPSVPLPNP